MYKIRTFLVFIVLLALAPLLILEILNYRSSLRSERQVVLNRNLEVSRTVAAGFRAFILQVVQTEEAGGLAVIEGGFNGQETNRYFNGLRARNRQLASISYAGPTGKVITATSGPAEAIPPQNLAKIRAGSVWAVSDLKPTLANRLRARFHVTAAVRVRGKVMALVDGVVGDRAVFDFIKIKIGRRGNIGIIDHTGRAAALSFKEDLTWRQRDRSFIPSIRQAIKGRASLVSGFHDPLGNVDRLGASTPIPDVAWVANVFQPVDDVIGPIREQSLGEALRSVFVAAIAMLIVLALSRQITKPIAELAGGTEPFRAGKFDHRLPEDYRIVEIKELAQALNVTAAETQHRFEVERNIAATLQAGLLQIEPPDFAGYEIGTRYASATEQALVGGDFYDFIPLRENRAGIAIGDIQGKGVAASIATLTTKFALRDLAARHDSPAEVLYILNTICNRELKPDEFITLAFASLNLETGGLSYAAAGHHPPIICGSGVCRKLTENGAALGILVEGDYKIGRDRLEPGEIMVLYTDGVVEARAEKELFGLGRLEKIVSEHRDLDPQLICELVYQACEKFTSGHLTDDIALVAVKRLTTASSPPGPKERQNAHSRQG